MSIVCSNSIASNVQKISSYTKIKKKKERKPSRYAVITDEEWQTIGDSRLSKKYGGNASNVKSYRDCQVKPDYVKKAKQ